ncbi:hypothetical protein PHLGIDRAFT_80590, partial [Phlebiopsis gigantea 11061_1 CR5-6]
RAFVGVRPPGHHCLPTRPAGVGFVNNVILGAVHAIQKHHYKNIVILDIDLHHGNGTQRVVRNVNDDDTQNQRLSMYFGSIHDIDKYPCDTDAELRQYAQERFDADKKRWVENVPLAPYTTEAEFWALYETQYTQILDRAREFLELTDAKPHTTMVFIRYALSRRVAALLLTGAAAAGSARPSSRARASWARVASRRRSFTGSRATRARSRIASRRAAC